jgi:hypothetical protein
MCVKYFVVGGMLSELVGMFKDSFGEKILSITWVRKILKLQPLKWMIMQQTFAFGLCFQ